MSSSERPSCALSFWKTTVWFKHLETPQESKGGKRHLEPMRLGEGLQI
jgi:hypothetical protein